MRTVLLLIAMTGVAAAEPDNLRVDVRCADYWATPESGLRVSVDGAPQPPRDVNAIPVVAYTKAGPYLTSMVTDIGFRVAPGQHDVAIDAPGCAPLAEHVTVEPFEPTFVSGRLPVDDDSLRGPTGAPNGFGVTLGAYTAGWAAHTDSNQTFGASYNYDATSTRGFWMSTSWERRGLAIATDLRFGRGDVAGTAMATGATTGNPGPFPFTGSVMEMGAALRIGVRMPLHQVAVAAGSGIAGDFRLVNSTTLQTNPLSDAFVADPIGPDASFFVPLWAALTYKPSCHFGAQMLASLDVQPTATRESTLQLGAGLMWQPSSACSEPAGLAVR